MKKLLKMGLPAALLCAALAFTILFKAVPVFAEGPDAEPEVFAEEIKTFLADNNVENLYVQELNLQDEVYSMGSLAGTSENVSLEANNAKEVQDALTQTLESVDFAVDVSKYEIPVREASSLVSGVLNDNPQYFYVEDACVSVNEDEIIQTIYFEYHRDATEEMVAYEAVVQSIIASIDDSWTDVQKLLYVHDYIVLHCEYDIDFSNDNKYNVYGVLLDGDAVCNGYALAYKDICNRLGIRTEFIQSQEGNHAWNLVFLNGKGYFVDTTWDDPVYTYEQRCGHIYFLKSQDWFDQTHGSSSHHNHTDIMIDYTTPIRDVYNNKEFDDAAWTDSTSPMIISNGSILFVKHTGSGNGGLFTSDSNGNNANQICTVTGKWPSGSGGYWVGFYGSLIKVGDKIFINGPSTVYRLNSDNTLSSIRTLSSAETQKGYIYGMHAEGAGLICDLATGTSDSAKQDEITIDLSTAADADNPIVVLNKTFISFDTVGKQERLTVTTKPSGLAVTSWSSSDPKVATVSGGLVTAVGYGKTVVSAKVGNTVARCIVAVDTTWQDDYDFEAAVGDKIIYLDKYNGSAKNLTVPAKAIVSGVECKTVIRGKRTSSGSYWFEGVYMQNTALETITFEDGVEFGERLIENFYQCTSLKKVDMSNCDTSKRTRMYFEFSGCKALEEVDFTNCDFGSLTDYSYAFNGCKALKLVRTPSVMPIAASIPVTLYENRCTSLGTTGYSDLHAAPANAELVSSGAWMAFVLNAEAEEGKVNLSWSTMLGAVKYDIFRKAPGESQFTKIGETTGLQYTDSAVQAGKTYTYYIRFVTAKGRYSGVYDITGKTVTTPNAVIEADFDVELVSAGVKVSWDAVDGVAYYRIFRKAEGEATFTGIKKTNALSYTDKTAEPGTTYRYYVRCIDANGKYIGKYYAEGKSITTPAEIKADFTLENTSKGVKVAWNAVDGVAYYRIFRKAAGEATFTGIKKTNALSYTDKTAEAGKTYLYYIRCIDANGKYVGTYNADGVRIDIPAEIKAEVTITRVSKGLKISWNAVDGVASYRIFKKAEGETTFAGVKKITATEYTDKAVEAGKTYTYYVRCIDADGKYIGTYKTVDFSVN